MTVLVSAALAPSFSWVSAGTGLDLDVKIGATKYTATIPTTDARILLGKGATAGTAEPLPDFLQVVAAAINTAIVASGRTITVAMVETGRVSLTIDSGTFEAGFNTAPVGAVLGFTTYLSGAGTYTATYQPEHLALLTGCEGEEWRPSTPIAARTTIAGRQYGITSGVTREEAEFTFGFIPRAPDSLVATGAPQTPWHPLDASLATIGSHALPWSIRDVIAQCLGRTCGFTRWKFQALRTSTTETYDLVSMDENDIATPRLKVQRRGWTEYVSWTVKLCRQQTPVAARA